MQSEIPRWNQRLRRLLGVGCYDGEESGRTHWCLLLDMPSWLLSTLLLYALFCSDT
jgi:hypothetical protein